ncbi:hypothetical protein IB75_15620 [Nitrosococcus oceani C-27]|uniref:Phage-Barnase-EndoU-ColicinE5/D-RelE like nuclease 2 domain-containing protein n=1 Tax=Nitrosococcus oceani C-27 TaxID=314279 RepID=A0A0E2YY38_9GAMM|nr:hypothetical protein IB75_15620 [Nitrosococcus oceani C-27]KFI21410.1 hypothetical protein HW44_15275 [Nitrosococcus oceani]GEM20043.1 hypothetical protein NONS58_14480 [Nitrosococcus oceani]
MAVLEDFNKRSIRLTNERRQHLESAHPEMKGQIRRVGETLASPDKVVRSRTYSLAELFYKFYHSTPVTEKYLCIVVKSLESDHFIITAYFTDSVKRGEILWKRM